MSFSMQNVLDGIAQDKNVNKLDSSLKKNYICSKNSIYKLL